MRLVIFLLLTSMIACDTPPPKAGAPPPRPVDLLTLSPTPVRDAGEYMGLLASRQSVSVQPQVAGYVRKIHVRPGQQIIVGDVLVEVDARQESAAVASAEAQLRSTNASLDLAKQTLARTRSLYQEGLVSAQELERAQASTEAAEAANISVEAQVTQRRVELQDYAVRAPLSGTGGDVLVRVGDFVTANTPLSSIAQSDVLEVSVAVPPERARGLAIGTPVELLDDDGEILVTTQIYFVAPQADPRTRLVEVKAVFENHSGLRPAEVLRTRVVYGVRDALQVPALAVVRQSGQSFVFVAEDKDGQLVAARRAVTLGGLGERNYVVEQGLNEGERIAVSSLQALRDGAPIEPKPTGG